MECLYTAIGQEQIRANSASQLAMNDERVVSARHFECEKNIVLALVTTPFYLKSERDQFLRDMETTLSQSIGKNVVVTLDIDVYLRIKEDMTEQEKIALYKKVVSRQNEQETPF